MMNVMFIARSICQHRCRSIQLLEYHMWWGGHFIWYIWYMIYQACLVHVNSCGNCSWYTRADVETRFLKIIPYCRVETLTALWLPGAVISLPICIFPLHQQHPQNICIIPLHQQHPHLYYTSAPTTSTE